MGKSTTEQSVKSENKGIEMELTGEELREFYLSSERLEDYKRLRERIQDPEISHKDFAQLLGLLWKHTIKPLRQDLDVTSDGDKITGYTFEVVRSNDKKD